MTEKYPTLPCPFCGELPLARPSNHGVGGGKISIFCFNDECRVMPCTPYEREGDARLIWNHRAAQSAKNTDIAVDNGVKQGYGSKPDDIVLKRSEVEGADEALSILEEALKND